MNAPDKAFIISVIIILVGVAIYCFGFANGISFSQKIDEIFKRKHK